MTVAELIEKLREMPQDAVVAVPYEWGISGIMRATHIGMVEAKGFLDSPELETRQACNERNFDANQNPVVWAVVID